MIGRADMPSTGNACKSRAVVGPTAQRHIQSTSRPCFSVWPSSCNADPAAAKDKREALPTPDAEQQHPHWRRGPPPPAPPPQPAQPQPQKSSPSPSSPPAQATCGVAPKGPNYPNRVSCTDDILRVHVSTSVTTKTANVTATGTKTITSTSTVTTTSTVIPPQVSVTATASTVTSSLTMTATTFTTTSTTMTATVTAAASPVYLPQSCNNQGIQWAYFDNPLAPYNDVQSGYDAWDPTAWKQATPQANGASVVIGNLTDQTANIYGTAVPQNEYFAVNHQGYIFANTTGTYTFVIYNLVDDVADIWTGATAYSGWTRQNVALEDLYPGSGPDGSAAVYTAQLTQLQYYPFRFMFGQAQGGFVFNAAVIDPNGNVLLSGSSNSPYIVQYSCDGVAAPPFQPWGQET